MPTAQVRGRAAVSQRAGAVVWVQMWPRAMAYRTGQREMTQLVLVSAMASVGRGISGYSGFCGLEEGERKGEGWGGAGCEERTWGADKPNTRGMEKAVAMKASYEVWRFRGIPGLTGRNTPK